MVYKGTYRTLLTALCLEVCPGSGGMIILSALFKVEQLKIISYKPQKMPHWALLRSWQTWLAVNVTWNFQLYDDILIVNNGENVELFLKMRVKKLWRLKNKKKMFCMNRSQAVGFNFKNFLWVSHKRVVLNVLI